jgi:anti-repressor protein
MYALIFGSKKPEARRFKHWVTSEVLPGLRNGKYGEAGAAEYDIEYMKLLAHLNTPTQGAFPIF